MSLSAGQVSLDVVPDLKQFGPRVKSGVKSQMGGIAKFLGAAFVAKKAFDFFKTGTQEAERADSTVAKLATTLKSMGRNIPVSTLTSMADALEKTTGFESEAIQDGERLFSTFGNITDKMVKELTPSVVDFAAQFTSGNIDSAAILMGKALDNPIRGLASLTRVGVTFSEKQREQITAMVESGHAAKAQGVIMEALHPQIDGVAKAGQTFGKRFSNSFGNAREALTRLFLPAITLTSEGLASLFEWFQRGGPIVIAVTATLGLFAAAMLVAKIHTAFAAGEGAVYLAVTTAQAIATGVATAAQWLWNAALSANPIGVVIVAIGLLVAGLVWLVTKTKIGQKIFHMFGSAIASVFNWVKKNWPLILAILTGPIGLAVLFIVRKWDGIVDFVKRLPGRLLNAAKGMWNWVTAGAKGAVNTVIGWINWLIDKINSVQIHVHINPPGPGSIDFDWGGLGIPNVPTLARGGVVRQPTFAMLGEAGPEAVVPLSRGGGQMHVIVDNPHDFSNDNENVRLDRRMARSNR